MKKVLTIAGSDSSGGAGIQADIKTITAHKAYAMSVITALTAQNTIGVYGISDVCSEFVVKQLDCVFTDIRPDAVKIGMVSNPETIKVIAHKLCEYNALNIVVDPVMVSTSGSALSSDTAVDALITSLLPLAAVITPNIPEAEVLSEMKIFTREDMARASHIIYEKINSAVLIKGGHSINDAADFLFTGRNECWFEGTRIDNSNTHGTGCTLSSAIACGLAEGKSLEESIESAKVYITGALRAGLDIGTGNGPLDHMWNINVNS